MAPASANKIAVLMLSLALVQSYPHMGQRASSSLSDERQGDGTTFAEVAGAAYAPSKPLVGSTTAFNFPTKKQIPVTRCAALAATIDRHTFWFNGKPPEDHAEGPIPTRKLPTRSTNLEALPISNQQDAETLFVGDIISMLCGKPHQTDDEYMAILHGMLASMRTHINRHVHSAFWVKHACAALTFNCYEAPNGTTITADTLPCVQNVLDHEPYNLVEGYFVQNLTMTLIAHGADFCKLPDLQAQVDTMAWQLSAVQTYHRSSTNFDDLIDDAFAQLCTAPEDNLGDYQNAYEKVATFMDADVYAEVQDCTIPEDLFAQLPYLSTNPPSVSDLISLFEQDTNITIIAAGETLAAILEDEGCVDPATNKLSAAASKRILTQLHASGLTTNSHEIGDNSSMPVAYSFSLGTAYHKLGVQCFPWNPRHELSVAGGFYSSNCRDAYGQPISEKAATSLNHRSPLFDITTSTDITVCNGAACKAAAKAVLAYQTFLGLVTPTRYDLIQAKLGAASHDPVMTSTSVTKQRSCAAMERIATTAALMQKQLPGVVAGLRAVAPQLEAACVAPPRDPLDSSRVAMTLGEVEAAARGADVNQLINQAHDYDCAAAQ